MFKSSFWTPFSTSAVCEKTFCNHLCLVSVYHHWGLLITRPVGAQQLPLQKLHSEMFNETGSFLQKEDVFLTHVSWPPARPWVSSFEGIERGKALKPAAGRASHRPLTCSSHDTVGRRVGLWSTWICMWSTSRRITGQSLYDMKLHLSYIEHLLLVWLL